MNAAPQSTWLQRRWLACGALVVLAACSSRDQSHARSDGADAAAGEDGGRATDEPDGGDCPEFWRYLAINGEWAEFFPTLRDLALGSDVVAYGPIGAVTEGVLVQGDAPEDVYSEVLIALAPTAETFRGDARPGDVRLTITPGAATVTAEALAACVPDADVLVFARKRSDQDAYRPVSGYGLWASTPRAAVDAPLEVDPPGDGLYGDELAGLASMEELVDTVRGYLDSASQQ